MVEYHKNMLCQKLNVEYNDTKYLIGNDIIQKDMYDINDDHISILSKDGKLKDITEASEILNIDLLSKKIRKYYFCYHRI